MRFAAQLQFGSKTQQVANTALRLVQRLKRDSIHSGRRPSGLCGAALLLASRWHEFNRSAADVVKIVKVHESTLRKRLTEFSDTPSSALTLEEFMTVDLEEEQDPPSFKAARKKDKERLQKLMEEEAESITDLQRQIEMQLEKDSVKKKAISAKENTNGNQEMFDTKKFIHESTLGTIQKIIHSEDVDEPNEVVQELGPNIESMGLASSLDDTSNAFQPNASLEVDLTFDDIDDAELDSYIMTETEFERKKGLWHKTNAAYLEEQKIKAERLQKEREEGKPEKKRKRATRKKPIGPVNSAGEAIEKILQEKKISSKINYDVLKSLNTATVKNEPAVENEAAATTSESIKRRRLSVSSLDPTPPKSSGTKVKAKAKPVGLPICEDTPKKEIDPVTTTKANVTTEDAKPDVSTMSEEENEEYYDEEEQVPEDTSNEMGVLQMLRQHREDDEGDDFGYGYFEEEY